MPGNGLEKGSASLEGIGIAAPEQRDCPCIDRRCRSRDGHIEKVEALCPSLPMQVTREFRRNRAHLEDDSSRLRRRKDAAVVEVDATNSCIICQGRNNHIRISHEVRNRRCNGNPPLVDLICGLWTTVPCANTPSE